MVIVRACNFVWYNMYIFFFFTTTGDENMVLELQPRQPSSVISVRVPQSLLNDILEVSQASGATRSNVITVSLARGLIQLKSLAGRERCNTSEWNSKACS